MLIGLVRQFSYLLYIFFIFRILIHVYVCFLHATLQFVVLRYSRLGQMRASVGDLALSGFGDHNYIRYLCANRIADQFGDVDNAIFVSFISQFLFFSPKFKRLI